VSYRPVSAYARSTFDDGGISPLGQTGRSAALTFVTRTGWNGTSAGEYELASNIAIQFVIMLVARKT
jgi:hypothetical protein